MTAESLPSDSSYDQGELFAYEAPAGTETPFDPAAFSAAVVAHTDPYKAYDERLKQLDEQRRDNGQQTGTEQTGFTISLAEKATATRELPKLKRPKPKYGAIGGYGPDPEDDPRREIPEYDGPEMSEAERQAVLQGPGRRAARAAAAIIEMNLVSAQAPTVSEQLALTRARAEKRSRAK